MERRHIPQLTKWDEVEKMVQERVRAGVLWC